MALFGFGFYLMVRFDAIQKTEDLSQCLDTQYHFPSKSLCHFIKLT